MRSILVLLLTGLLFACSDDSETKDDKAVTDTDSVPLSEAKPTPTIKPKIVQPGLPGKPSREISAEDAADLAHVLYTDADVKFMQGMIMHHAQALDMTALVGERSENPELIKLAQRMELSQTDEIKTMQNWLKERNQEVTSEHAHHSGKHELMPGMLSSSEMSNLQESRTNRFDKLFLELMIKHHTGALIMVDELLDNWGAAQESIVYALAADIESDQRMEIKRMGEMLAELSPDPRVGLKAGYQDSETAAENITLLTNLPRPAGFYSPENPVGVVVLADEEEESTESNSEPEGELTEEQEEALEREETSKANRQEGKEREADSALFNFANTDMAFTKDVAIVGNYHGFNIYNIKKPESPELMTSVVCPGGQGDVSVVENLLIMSVEQTRGRLDCGLQGVAEKVSEERMRGIRIFDISDLSMPRQVGVVQTCRGSHTHTVVTEPDAEGNFYVYVSGTSGVRESEELAGCSDASQDPNTALFSIDVVEINLNSPQNARIVNQPRIFADLKTGSVAGLWKGGDHGRNTQDTNQTDHCHDITVFPEKKLAAGACSGNGILMDISDPMNPVRLDAATDKGFAYWHSATFNNDGTKVIFTDEWGGGGQPRCRASDPKTWGANAIFDIIDNQLEFRSYYKLPAPQSDKENCVAHNGSLIPVPGRDIMVQAWYQGGLSIFDFTDSANPKEIAYFDRGPVDDEHMITAGYWSVYWHRGVIYGSEIARGLDVLGLESSNDLSAVEIAAASTIDSDIVNYQFQRQFVWPDEPVVVEAYVEQLKRSGVVDEAMAERVKTTLSSGEGITTLVDELTQLSSNLSTSDQRKLNQVMVSMTRMAAN